MDLKQDTNKALEGSKNKAIELAMQAIEKQFGKGSIMRLGENETLVPADLAVVSTGSLSLDLALGIGGLPRGRIIEIYGPESSGKTTLALHAIAEIQKQGGTAAFVDAEHALDVGYARKLGVKTDDLLISQPDAGEQALEIADMLVRSGGVDLLVVDSVAALVPRAELEGDMGDSHMGLQARLMSQALRKLTGSINRSKTLVIFINQLRMKIGVMFGNPETTTGGNALKFYASVRLDIRRIGALKDGENVIGNRTRVKVVKNKMAPPFKEVEFDILYGEGISKEGDLLDAGANFDIIEKSGTWYTYKDERLGQGRDNSIKWLKEHKDAQTEIRTAVLAKSGVGKIEHQTAEQSGAKLPVSGAFSAGPAVSATGAPVVAKSATAAANVKAAPQLNGKR
ncbi:MAG: recombinase RecA [Xanthomonadaceae bacterium]|nr:recombinase RecA [Xanthomonadaceae bacterium]